MEENKGRLALRVSGLRSQKGAEVPLLKILVVPDLSAAKHLRPNIFDNSCEEMYTVLVRARDKDLPQLCYVFRVAYFSKSRAPAKACVIDLLGFGMPDSYSSFRVPYLATKDLQCVDGIIFDCYVPHATAVFKPMVNGYLQTMVGSGEVAYLTGADKGEYRPTWDAPRALVLPRPSNFVVVDGVTREATGLEPDAPYFAQIDWLRYMTDIVLPRDHLKGCLTIPVKDPYRLVGGCGNAGKAWNARSRVSVSATVWGAPARHLITELTVRGYEVPQMFGDCTADLHTPCLDEQDTSTTGGADGFIAYNCGIQLNADILYKLPSFKGPDCLPGCGCTADVLRATKEIWLTCRVSELLDEGQILPRPQIGARLGRYYRSLTNLCFGRVRTEMDFLLGEMRNPSYCLLSRKCGVLYRPKSEEPVDFGLAPELGGLYDARCLLWWHTDRRDLHVDGSGLRGLSFAGGHRHQGFLQTGPPASVNRALVSRAARTEISRWCHATSDDWPEYSEKPDVHYP